VSNTISSLLQAAGTYSPRKASIYTGKIAKNTLNSGKITICSFLELGPQRPLLVQENILGKNIFLPKTQGQDIKNTFGPHSTDKG